MNLTRQCSGRFLRFGALPFRICPNTVVTPGMRLCCSALKLSCCNFRNVRCTQEWEQQLSEMSRNRWSSGRSFRPVQRPDRNARIEEQVEKSREVGLRLFMPWQLGTRITVWMFRSNHPSAKISDELSISQSSSRTPHVSHDSPNSICKR